MIRLKNDDATYRIAAEAILFGNVMKSTGKHQSVVAEINTSAEERSGRAEQYKALFDHIKHIATLSTATILILFTLLQNFIKQPIARDLVKVSVVAFLLSIVAGAILFGILAVRFPRPGVDGLTKTEGDVVATAMLFAWTSFVVGVGCLGIFFWMNF